MRSAGQLPLIRAPKGNAAEMVARKLEARLRKLVAASRGGNVFPGHAGGSGDGAFGRPRTFVFCVGRRELMRCGSAGHSGSQRGFGTDG